MASLSLFPFFFLFKALLLPHLVSHPQVLCFRLDLEQLIEPGGPEEMHRHGRQPLPLAMVFGEDHHVPTPARCHGEILDLHH